MVKLVLVDGQPHRWRRGKLVPIPAEWVGQTAHPQSIRKRPSKAKGGKRVRKHVKHRGGWGTRRKGDGGFSGDTTMRGVPVDMEEWE